MKGMNNRHTNLPNSKEWEKEFDKQFPSCNGGDAVYAAIDDDGLSTGKYIKSFIRTLLTSHSEAIQERVEAIIADYMEALGTVVLPEEVWLWIADINGKYLSKNLKENI